MLPSYRPLVMMLSLLMMRSGAQAFLVGAGALPLGSRRAGAAAARAGLSGLLAVGARPSDVLLSTGSIPSTLEVILSRRTVNDFEPALPDGWSDALERSVLAATHAPNHKRTEPWRFHLLGPVAVKRVCELNAELVAAKKGPEAGEKKLARWLAMPGWLVVTQVVDGSSMEEPAGVAREDYAACCCAVQNLCLSLHSEGSCLSLHSAFPSIRMRLGGKTTRQEHFFE